MNRLGSESAYGSSSTIADPCCSARGYQPRLGRNRHPSSVRFSMPFPSLTHNLHQPSSEMTRAPVIWSHSASRHFNNISRNVPDYILKHIGSGKGQKDGVVMVNIYPAFMLPPDKQQWAHVGIVADHVQWMANLMGKAHVGIGSDFDGIETVPKGMEDVSKYPALVRRDSSKTARETDYDHYSLQSSSRGEAGRSAILLDSPARTSFECWKAPRRRRPR
jgi:hypothetical protein